jgi:hypothetical protein
MRPRDTQTRRRFGFDSMRGIDVLGSITVVSAALSAGLTTGRGWAYRRPQYQSGVPSAVFHQVDA